MNLEVKLDIAQEAKVEQSGRIVIPSNYATSHMIRNVAISNDNSRGKHHWLAKHGKAARTKRINIEDVVDDITNGSRKTTLVGTRCEYGRKLGKPFARIITGRLVADEVVGYFGEYKWGPRHKILILRRELLEIRKDHIEEQSTLTGFAISKHALERMYERENCTHHDISSKICSDIEHVSEYLAFAMRSRICTHGQPDNKGTDFIIPVGDGLMIVRNVVIMIEKDCNPASRLIPSRDGRMLEMPICQNSERMVAIDPIGKIKVQGHIMALGMTYLSFDMLSLEQVAYRELFIEEASRHDLTKISDETYSIKMMHHKNRVLEDLKISERLRYLFGVIVRPRPQSYPYLAIGWNGDNDIRIT